ncbi:unnamed protein product [Cladocopium goreaui]|uniref:Uncharacterized protein n=1 Tax=Cladocopium goreaui TaxID=2562237 RepID=A0A9P1C2W4_9DINO|nr:unnamed protein product [Cladocopium goreaui]
MAAMEISSDEESPRNGGTKRGTVVDLSVEDEPVTNELLSLDPLVGNIHEMRQKLVAMESGAKEDVDMGSPTEVFDEEYQSELDAVWKGEEGPEVATEHRDLQQVLDVILKRQATVDLSGEQAAKVVKPVDGGMGLSEKLKLKPHIPDCLKMPWERGFAGLVLGKAPEVMEMPNLSAMKAALMVEEEIVEPKEDDKMPADVFVRSGFKPLDRERKAWQQAEADERTKLMAGWMVVIHEAGDQCAAGQMLDESGENVLEDIFARKKNGTLQVRLSAMMLYVRWCKARDLAAFPLREQQVYQYVDDLRKNRAPATRAGSFRSALAFCKGTLQLKGVDEVLDSGRIAGSAHRSYVTKRVLRQRDALTVHQIQTLEALVENPLAPLQDRLFAGHCLLCVYGRLRFGDSQGIEEEPKLDGDYIEGGTTIHKTDSLVGRARRILPVVAPSRGVSGVAWAEEFLRLRAQAGLRALPGRPFMPAPITGGGWSQSRLSTSEASNWLCELLKRYSMEKMDMSNVIKDIRMYRFRPDLPRSERWKDPPAEMGDAEDADDDLLVEERGDLSMEEIPTPGKKSVRLAEVGELSTESEESGDEVDESETERNLEAVVQVDDRGKSFGVKCDYEDCRCSRFFSEWSGAASDEVAQAAVTGDMATLTESKAVFEAKLKENGLDGYKLLMSGKGWTTLSTFAFASSWAPGTGDDTAFMEQVVRPILGRNDHQDLPRLRKLYHEAYTIVAAELRTRLEGTQEADGSKTRKLPPVERKTRWAQVKQRYPHLQIGDQLEPAHHVVDKCHSMKVEGDLRYLAPHEIPTRDQEMQNVKTEELIKKDASGHLKAHDETKLPDADLKTDLRMRQAYMRRGLAMEVADIMTYTSHEKLVDRMFQEYQREPPMGYAQVTLKQLAEADRRAWKLMAEDLQGDLGRDTNGERLADLAVDKVLVHPAFTTLLMPLPGARSSAAASSGDQDTEPVGAGKRKLMKENQRLKERLREAESSQKDKKSKHQEAPVTPQVKKMPIKMPRELWGYQPMKKGKRICYGFQLNNCTNKVQNGECAKGLHVCMKCWKDDHGAQQCSQ